MIVNRSSNERQANAHIFHILGSTDAKQRVSNYSCFVDHNATMVFAVITSLHCETSAQKNMNFL